jgi:hypothetical protein
MAKFARVFFFTFTALAIVMSFQAFADAATCKVRLEEMNTTIIGRGRTAEAAFEDAAMKCFDKKADQAPRPSQSKIDEDSGLAIIDQCANLRCEG